MLVFLFGTKFTTGHKLNIDENVMRGSLTGSLNLASLVEAFARSERGTVVELHNGTRLRNL